VFLQIEEMGMKIKLALAAAAILGAFAITAPSNAAPLAGAGVATQGAKVDAKATEEVRHRRWHRRHWRHRHYHRRHWRHRRYYRPYYYRPYYGYNNYYGGYPYYGGRHFRRGGVYFGFGF
jgi:hypothetical protein